MATVRDCSSFNFSKIFRNFWIFLRKFKIFQILHMVKGGNLDMDREQEKEYNVGHANREATPEIILDQKNAKNMENGSNVDQTR